MPQMHRENTSVKIERKLAIIVEISFKHSIIGYGAAVGAGKKAQENQVKVNLEQRRGL